MSSIVLSLKTTSDGRFSWCLEVNHLLDELECVCEVKLQIFFIRFRILWFSKHGTIGFLISRLLAFQVCRSFVSLTFCSLIDRQLFTVFQIFMNISFFIIIEAVIVFSIHRYNSETDLPIFSAPELVKFEFQNVIPDQILRSLAMYSTKLKEVRLEKVEGHNKTVYFPLRALEKVYIFIGGASDELIEILCRQNRDLQSIQLEYGKGLTAVSMTHLATLEHLTNITFQISQSKLFCTPTSLLSFLRNRASRPKNIKFFTSYISSNIFRVESQLLVELRDEIERQKLEDGSLISISCLDRFAEPLQTVLGNSWPQRTRMTWTMIPW